MNTKSMVWIGMFVGGTLGGFVPMLWGGDTFSMAGIVWNAVGAIAGIWCGYKLANW